MSFQAVHCCQSPMTWRSQFLACSSLFLHVSLVGNYSASGRRQWPISSSSRRSVTADILRALARSGAITELETTRCCVHLAHSFRALCFSLQALTNSLIGSAIGAGTDTITRRGSPVGRGPPRRFAGVAGVVSSCMGVSRDVVASTILPQPRAKIHLRRGDRLANRSRAALGVPQSFNNPA